MNYCANCGSKMRRGVRFCGNCGAKPKTAAKTSNTPKASDGPPTGLALFRNPDTRSAIVKALAKSLAISAAVIGPGILLLMAGAQALGMLWLFAGSFGMVAWTYQKPWRLGLVSCLLPPLMAALCYLIQLALFSDANVDGGLVLFAVLAGAAVGWYRGQAHEVYEEKGQLFARRTLAYLVIWAAAYGITQMMAFTAVNVFAVRAGLVTGAFSTAMLAAVSIIIFAKRRQVSQAAAALVAVVLGAGLLLQPAPAQAQFGGQDEPPAVADILASIDPEIRSQIRYMAQGQLSASRVGSVRGSGRNSASATYRISAGGDAASATVTLRRLSSAAAADPSRAVHGKVDVVRHLGFPIYTGFVASQRGPHTIYAAAAKENYLITSQMRTDDFDAVMTVIVVAGVHQALDLSALEPEEPATPRQPPVQDDFERDWPSDEDEIAEEDGAEEDGVGDDIAIAIPGSDGEVVYINPSDAAIASTLIVTILIAAGVGANVAQAIAGAVAGAVQASGEVIAETVGDAAGAPSGVAAVAPDAEADTPPAEPPPEPTAASEPSPRPVAAAEPPAEEAPGFMEGIWNRAAGAVSGAATEIGNLVTDIANDPTLIAELPWETVKGGAKEVWDAGADVVDVVGDMLDPEIMGDTMVGTYDDAVKIGEDVGGAISDGAAAVEEAWNDPIVQDNMGEIIGDTMVGTYDDIAGGLTAAGEWLGDAITDPNKVVDGVKLLTGGTDLEKSMDPNLSIWQRGGHFVMGAAGAVGTITGGSSVVQGLKTGASKVLGRAAAGMGDDVARAAAGAGDDLARAAAGAGDEAAAAAGGAASASDDAARAGGGAAGVSDDAGRSASAAGAADDGAAGATAAADETGQAAARTPPEIDPNYDDYLRNRGEGAGSTIQPGHTDDYLVADGVPPDRSGYTRAADKHIQMVADQNGVQITARPTTAKARDLIESGAAVAKGELIKNKSISKVDALIGADPDNIALVGHFDPKAPPPVGSPMPPKLVDEFDGAKVITQDIYDAAKARQAQRAEEFTNQAAWIKKNKDSMYVNKDGLIIDVKSGKPITGDVDLWDIRGVHGETLPKATVDHVTKSLIGRKTGQFQHPNHMGWDYTKLSRSPQAGGAASKFDISRGIDGKIRGGHGPGPGGEELVAYTGRMASRPGMAPDPVAKVYVGTQTNPLVEKRLIAPIADRHGVNISRGRGRLSITDANGNSLSPEIERLIRNEVSQGRYGPVAQRHGAKMVRQPGPWQITDRTGRQIAPSARNRIMQELDVMDDPARHLRRAPDAASAASTGRGLRGAELGATAPLAGNMSESER